MIVYIFVIWLSSISRVAGKYTLKQYLLIANEPYWNKIFIYTQWNFIFFTGLIIVQSAIVSVIDLNLSQTTIKSGNGYKLSAWSYDQ